MPDRASNARTTASALVAIVATYVYFLLFAQYGFIRLIGERGDQAPLVDQAMAGMGLTGLAVSLAAALLLARQPARRLLQLAFLSCGFSALLALCPHRAATLAASVLIGASTGLLTVSLATHLRRWITGPHFGAQAGAATGLAYFICNLPPVFDGRPLFQVLFSAAVCAAGFLAVTALPRDAATPPTAPACPGLQRADFASWGFASLLLALLALVWLDSTAFATIQQTTALKGRTWGGPHQQLLNGLLHLLAAMAAGALMDRGYFRGLLLGVFALFVVAFRLLDVWGTDAALAAPLYVIGISTYSVALILVPSARADETGLLPARWRAALLYGIAGWLGSALGVGMAQHLHRLPGELIIAAGLVIATGYLVHQRARWHLIGLLAPVTLAILFFATRPDANDADRDPVARGREVYRQEACITCHSQYIRPLTHDVAWWGPYRAPDFQERPPFIGNRRQGPDLMNVGLRRSAEWQQRHLENPRALSPGSRMPAYSHLFTDGSTRGDDLVAYLGSLGRGHEMERLSFIRNAPMPHETPDPARGQKTFQRNCAPCHGDEGRGDGPEAARFFRPAMDLRKGDFWYTGRDLTPAQLHTELARIVRFGVFGTSMPGHETFTDQQVADVAAYVQQLSQVHE
jgi:mono/diheme cytochrome c family protein/uncharacterized membrane protein